MGLELELVSPAGAEIVQIDASFGAPVLALSLLLACPPTSIPTGKPDAQQQQQFGYLVAPYGLPVAVEDTPVAPRSSPEPTTWLPLWDLDASALELDALLASDEVPEWVPWVAWAIAAAKNGTDTHLVGALSSDMLTAERLAWWRAITPTTTDTRDVLLDSFAAASSPRTQLLLASALALESFELACPVPSSPDGACRLPGSNTTLLRRLPTEVEDAQRWGQTSAGLQSSVAVDASDVATLALLAEVDLMRSLEDYEALLLAALPGGLEFAVDDWRHDSGVPAWEAEYTRQRARADVSHARAHAFFASTSACIVDVSNRHVAALGIDTASTAEVLLRQARIYLAFAEALNSASDDAWRNERRRRRDGLAFTGLPNNRGQDQGPNQVSDQATLWFESCYVFTTSVAVQNQIADVCASALAAIDPARYPTMAEFVPDPAATTSMRSYVVIPG